MAFKLAAAFVELSTKGYNVVTGHINAIKKNLFDLTSTAAGGFGVALTGAGMLSFLRNSVLAFEEANQSAKRLEATLRLSGGTTGRTAFEIKNLSDQISGFSNFSGDAIASAAGMIAEFQNIRGTTFDAAVQSTVDLASRTGDLQGAAKRLGAALDDPANNVSLLRREFKAFSADVAENAEKLARSGDIVGAQNLILKELQRTTGGLASAMVSDIEQMKNAWGDFSQEVGRNIMSTDKMLGNLVGSTKGFARAMADAFKSGAVSDFMLPQGDSSPWKNIVKTDRSERAAAEARAARGVARTRTEPTATESNEASRARLRSGAEATEGRTKLLSQLDVKGMSGTAQEAAEFELQLKEYARNLEKVYADYDGEVKPRLDALRTQFESEQSRKRMQLMAGIDAEGSNKAVADSIRFTQHLADVKDQLTKAGVAAPIIEQKLDAIRTQFEKTKAREKMTMALGIDADTLTGVQRDLSALNAKLLQTVQQMKDAGFSADEIAQARQQLIGKFQREQGEKQGDIIKGLLGEVSPTTIKRRLEIDVNAAELKKKIEDAFPEGEIRTGLLGDIDELRKIQQKQETLDQQKAPEFVGITELAKKIQIAAFGGGKEALEKEQAKLMAQIADQLKMSGGLPVRLSDVTIQELAKAGGLR